MGLYRIIVIDQFSQITHAFFNEKLLHILSKMNAVEKVIFIAHSRIVNETDSKFMIPKVELIFIDQIYQKKLRLWKEYKKFLFIRAISSRFSPTHIIFSSFENLTFSLFSCLLPRVPIICFLHYNLDDLILGRFRTIKRLLLNLQQKRCDFIVFEDFLKEKLSTVASINCNKIHIIQHPIEKLCEKEMSSQNQVRESSPASAVIFIPSGSSDFQIIEQLINDNELKKLGYKFYSKYYREINLDWFTAKPHFSKKEYSDLMKEADLVYIPYAKQVGYRISGPILESIYCRKYILANENPLTRFILEKYPYTLQIIKSAVLSFDDIKDLYEIREKHQKEYEESWKKFVQDHSDENISSKLIALLDKTFIQRKVRTNN